MTILSGEVTKAEGQDIIEEMDITPEEMLAVLTDEDKQSLIDQHNEVCDDWDGEPVGSIEELPDFVFDDWREWVHWRNPENLAVEVLVDREQEYVHLADDAQWGETFHTIVEVER